MSICSFAAACCLLPAACCLSPAADFHVAPEGKDSWSGKLAAAKPDGSDGPFATLGGARDAIRRLKATAPPKKPIRVLVRGGTYRVSEPIVFVAEDSGTKEASITYAAYPGEKPVISGGMPITGWKKEADGPLWTTVIPAVQEGKWHFRQLFVDGRRCTPARIPNDDVYQMAGPLVPLEDRGAAQRDPNSRLGFHYQGEDLKPWADLDEAIVVAYHSWTTSRHHVKLLEPETKTVRFSNPSAWPFGWWGKERFYVECIREGLDAPGEWHLDLKTGVLAYHPRPGEDMNAAEVIAPGPQELLRLEGDAAAGKPVRHLHFEGLSFQHTGWIMLREEMVDGQANAGLTTAAVYARGARNCTFEKCEIAHTGGYALWLQLGCKDNRVVQCHIHDLGAGGVRIGEQVLPKEPQQQTERTEVYNCFIHNGGNVYHAGIGVWIGRSSHNTIHHNDICDFFYTGVSVGWSWGYAPTSAHHNAIEHNHIHHLGWGQLSDMGGIYCLGISPGTRLRYNLIHDVLSYSYGGWGLYTDEGSTDILMENNVVYRVKDGAFHQHYGRENILRNNILALSATQGQIIRSREEEHRSFTLQGNIIYSAGVPMLGGNWTNGNFLLEGNCYFDATGATPTFPGGLTLAQWQEKGQDVGSVIADQKFVDPQHFDFGLKDDSPALKLGFKPIDTATIGLVGPPQWVELPKQVQRPEMKLPGEE